LASRLTINRFETEIDSPYITKSLHPDTLAKILDTNDETVYRLYQITSNKKEIKYFAEIKGDDLGYSFNAYVKTSYAFAGDAREQIESIGNHTSLLLKRPMWTIKSSLTNLYTNEIVFNYHHEVSTSIQVYDSMTSCLVELNNKLNEKVS
jgi:hypothetical protein